jgi:hypothetical protein
MDDDYGGPSAPSSSERPRKRMDDDYGGPSAPSDRRDRRY